MNDTVPDHLNSDFTPPSIKWLEYYAGVDKVLQWQSVILSWLLPVHLEDFKLLGFAFEGQFYIDRALTKGCSVSCSAFEWFSSFLQCTMWHRTGLWDIAHFLDDFLLVGQVFICFSTL